MCIRDRRTADRVNRIAEEERSLQENQDYHTGEHVLVCITAAPSSTKVIRTAVRLADAFHAKLTGLCVETPELQEADEKTKAALRNNMEPVSYTHLDVYKRQREHRRHWTATLLFRQ